MGVETADVHPGAGKAALVRGMNEVAPRADARHGSGSVRQEAGGRRQEAWLQPGPSFFEQVCRRASDAPRSPEIARRGPEIARDSARSPEIARRGPRRGGWVGSEGAEVFSAVDGELGAREPDL